MKNANISSKTLDLLIDVVDYAFVEWLIRQGIFTVFRSNFNRANSFQGSFRDNLRDLIRYSFSSDDLGPEHLISSAFLFSSTPEGANFWFDRSAAWECFYAKFQKKH